MGKYTSPTSDPIQGRGWKLSSRTPPQNTAQTTLATAPTTEYHQGFEKIAHKNPFPFFSIYNISSIEYLDNNKIAPPKKVPSTIMLKSILRMISTVMIDT
jgi:hypothetical protein